MSFYKHNVDDSPQSQWMSLTEKSSSLVFTNVCIMWVH